MTKKLLLTFIFTALIFAISNTSGASGQVSATTNNRTQDDTFSNEPENSNVINILANEQFVYGLNVSNFDTTAYLDNIDSPLAVHASFIEEISLRHSINPRLLLTIIELREQSISDPHANINDGVGYQNISNFEVDFETLIIDLSAHFYASLYRTPNLQVTSQGDWLVPLKDGTLGTVSGDVNAATLSILATLGPVTTREEWNKLIDPNADNSFLTTYKNLFPEDSPFDNTHSVVPNNPPPSDLLKFPFSAGDTWYFTGGPHSWNGCSAYPYSGVDFAPFSSSTCAMPTPTDRWVTLPAEATINDINYDAGQLYVDFTVDGAGGWRGRFLHVDNIQVQAGQTYPKDYPIGNPSCIGLATGIHVHFDLMYGGGFYDFVAIEGTLLEGWSVHGTTCYNGYLQKDSDIIWVNGAVTSLSPDTTPPTIDLTLSGTQGQNGWYRSNVQATLTAQDNPGGSGVSNVQYRLNNGSWQTVNGSSATFTITDQGITSVQYRATDNAGLTSDISTEEVKIDRTAPTVSTVLPPPTGENGWYTDNVQVIINGGDTGGSLFRRIQYRLGTTGDWTNVNGNSATVTISAQGSSTLQYRGEDNAGNTSSTQSVVVRIDKTNPTLSNTLINNDSPETNQVNVQVKNTASDAHSGLWQIRFSTDNNNWSAWQEYSANKNWSIPPANKQNHIIYVQVRDYSGRTSTIASDGIVLNLYPERPSSNEYRLCASSLNTTGQVGAESSNYRLTSSIGANVGGVSSSGSTANAQSGFLAAVQACQATGQFNIYLPFVGR